MNYYQHHIGDFNNATRHLSLVERAIYRDLLDMYYDTEKAIDATNIDRLARRLQCATHEQITALNYVLDEFFTIQDGLYVNNRCEREITEFHGKRKQASEAGKASAKKRASKKQQNQDNGSSGDDQANIENSTDVKQASNENSTDVQPTINHKPLTNNQEPDNSCSSTREAEKSILPPINFATYKPEDQKRYGLLDCANQYPIQIDFIELAKNRFDKISSADIEILFSGPAMFCDFFTAKGSEASNTPSIWLVKWLSWIENNKDEVRRKREAKPSFEKQKNHSNAGTRTSNEVSSWMDEINNDDPAHAIRDVFEVEGVQRVQ